ncbi:MAG TPA: efflux RND transporter periplasmic adaptor subunit [Caulobacteraceae bacterium]|nr:efflux RND transporter periplasmic adaptor subunit [Caulobacteraceae bacterium]
MGSPRRFRWGFVVLAVLLVALIAWLVMGQKPAKPKGTPPVGVTVAPVTLQDVPTTMTALGAAQAWQGVLINPQINGRLTYVAREGDDVHPGTLLVQIDCGPFKAALTQAQGTLKRDQAQLAGARIDLQRFQTLVAQNSIAKQTADDQAATVKQLEGTVISYQGAVAAAQVNVSYCKITSPVAGRVGVRLVDPGNIVTTGLATGIVSVNQIEPIAVLFTVPQGDFQRLSEVSGGFTRPLAVEALSQETGADLGAGELIVADNHVDQTTGTVQMKARFANAGRTLWPGQFVNIKLTLETLHNAITVPAAAVNQGPKGAFVYLVGPGNKAVNRPVNVVTTEGTIAVIQGGLTPGQQVVTDGQMSLKPGSTVRTGQGGQGAPGAAAGHGGHGKGGGAGGSGPGA